MSTTREAAAIAGVKYETLRNWLKRGLLKHSQEEARGWRRYAEADYCTLVLMTEGLAAGISVETMIDVCRDQEVGRVFDRLVNEEWSASQSRPHHVLIWSTLPEPLFMLAPLHAIPHELTANPAPVTIFDLTAIHAEAEDRATARA